MSSSAGRLLRRIRLEAGLSQRELAKRARTAQSVIARIELGESIPTWTTMDRLARAAGYEITADARRIPQVDPSELADVPRILRLSPEDRLREVAQVGRFIANARRA